MRKCPKCGFEMEKAADWPDDWLICLNCLYSEKVKFGEERVFEGEKSTPSAR